MEGNIVYVRHNSMQSVSKAYKWLCAKTGTRKDSLQVYDLNYLVHQLLNGCYQIEGQKILAEELLNKTTFDYEANLVCEAYHAHPEPEKPGQNPLDWPNRVCSLARARQAALVICCQLTEKLAVGKHLPPSEKVDERDGGKKMSCST